MIALGDMREHPAHAADRLMRTASHSFRGRASCAHPPEWSVKAVLDYCERENIVFIPWVPIASGDLARSDGALGRIAKQLDATPAQVALAWLLHRSPVIVPIPGTSSIAHLEENVAAGALELSAEQVAELTAETG